MARLGRAVAVLVVGLAACSEGGGQGSGNQVAPDGGAPPGTDAQAPGADAAIVEPTAQGWTFYGSGNGGPGSVLGAAADEGGNLWVAGGEQGLFLMENGSGQFRRFTLGDGLHPWGTPFAGQGPVTRPYLNVLSVAGGPAGTAFVGYRGLEIAGEYGCEDSWDGPNPDPNVYKSGDADRVTLAGSGLQVSHYDISTGPGLVAAEPRGREKICDVHRIVYDAPSRSVWFGANHGYAWGDPAGTTVREHAHPLLNGFANETIDHEYALTGEYHGLAVEPGGNLWVGGLFRSQRCPAGMDGLGFWTCEGQGSLPSGQYALDWWPDAVHTDSRPSQRVDDHVSGMALGPDGSLWIGSYTNGLARRRPDGTVEFLGEGLADPLRVSSVAVDPSDGSVWVGATRGGLTRLQAGVAKVWDSGTLGSRASAEAVDIQFDRSGPTRKVIVAFRNGWVGVYDGP